MPLFTEATTPAGLLADHSAKAGVWARVHVDSGQLNCIVPEAGDATVLRAGTTAGSEWSATA